MLLPLGLAAALLSGCAAGPSVGETYRGVYMAGFESQAFWAEAGEGPWWVEFRGETGAQLGQAIEMQSGGLPWGMLEVEVKGALSRPGAFGHMGAYERKLTIREVLSVSPVPEGGRG